MGGMWEWWLLYSLFFIKHKKILKCLSFCKHLSPSLNISWPWDYYGASRRSFTAVSVLLLYSKFAMSCHAMSRRPCSVLSFLITCSEEATCAREDCQGCSPPHVPMGVHAMFLLCLPANEGSSGPFLSVLGGSPSYPSPHTLCGYRLLECGIFIWVFFCYFWLLPPTLFYVLPRNKNFEYLYIIYTEFSALILDVTILCCWSWSWRHHNWCC